MGILIVELNVFKLGIRLLIVGNGLYFGNRLLLEGIAYVCTIEIFSANPVKLAPCPGAAGKHFRSVEYARNASLPISQQPDSEWRRF